MSGEKSNSFTAYNSGEYALEIYNSTGCAIKTENVITTTLEKPAAPYITTNGSSDFCTGDSVKLTVTNTPDFTYEWKLNGGDIGVGPNLYAKNSGTYTVLVKNSLACSNESSNSVPVKVLPLPDISPVSLSRSTEFCENETLTMSVPLNSLYTYQWSNEFGPTGDTMNTLSTSSTGLYSLSISDKYGCKRSSPPIEVTARPIPTAPTIVTDNYIQGECPKDSPITLSVEQAIEGYSYQWKRNGHPIIPGNLTYLQDYLSMGDYTVDAIKDGCKNESPSQTIFFEDAPEKPLIFAEGPNIWYLACSNDSAAAYQWYYNDEAIDGADIHIYVAMHNLGSYSINISNDKGCIVSSDIIKIPLGTGIGDHHPFSDMVISPNPTTGILKVDMNNTLFGDLYIRIFTFEGRQIQNIRLYKPNEHFECQIDRSGQVGGMFKLKFVIDEYVTTRKVIVE
jgi:hypothetical protein